MGVSQERTAFLGGISLSPQSPARPEKWNDSQVGFHGSNASGGRIVLLPGAFWVHGASKMATFKLSASLLLCLLQYFQSLRRACFRQAHCFVQGPLRFLLVPPTKSHMRSLSHLGVSESPPLHMGKKGPIGHFPRALLASIWGQCSQILVFTSIWGTEKGV